MVNYSQDIHDRSIHIVPCAYLHNYLPAYRQALSNEIYEEWYTSAPFFIMDEVQQFSDFVKKFVTRKSANGDLLYLIDHGRGNIDIELPGGFKAKWNLENDKIWAINPGSFEEVGCIHTAQGLEFDYVGVLIGKDLTYDKASGRVVTNKSAISRDDNSSGIRGASDDVARRLILNTYKTLITRGQKGCYVYCEDEALSEYFSGFLKESLVD